MRHTRPILAIALLLALAAGLGTARAAGGPHAKPVIGNWAEEDEGAGIELGYGDVPAQCQSYANATNANPYQPFVTSVNVIAGDPFNAGAGVNQGCRTPQNETAIAVNPQNPLNLVAGSNDYRDCCVVSGGTLRNDGAGYVYTSFDGGRTWANIKLPGLGIFGDPSGTAKKVTSVGDPAIAFGANNTVYYANITFNRVDDSNAIFVSISRDGGLTWGGPVQLANSGSANLFNDKVFVGANPATGDAFVSWTLFKSTPSAGYVSSTIVGARTTNAGRSWASGIDVSGPYLYNQGSVPAYGKDGAIYVSFEGANPADGFLDYNIVAKSTDGQHFTQTVVSRNVDENFPIFGGRGVLSGLHFRTNTFPALAADPVTGKLYLTWADNSASPSAPFCDPDYGGSGCAPTSVQVFIQSSSDGVTWTQPTRLTAAPADKIYPWVAAYGGKVAVSFYTREFAGAASGEIDFAYVSSKDGGATWSGVTRITEESSDPSIQFAGGAFIGDYTGIAVGSDGVAHPIWTDFRGNPGVTSPNQDAVTAALAIR